MNRSSNKSLINKEQVTTISMNTLFSSCRSTGANNGLLFIFSTNLGHLQVILEMNSIRPEGGFRNSPPN